MSEFLADQLKIVKLEFKETKDKIVTQMKLFKSEFDEVVRVLTIKTDLAVKENSQLKMQLNTVRTLHDSLLERGLDQKLFNSENQC
jgi:hypothetical protein